MDWMRVLQTVSEPDRARGSGKSNSLGSVLCGLDIAIVLRLGQRSSDELALVRTDNFWRRQLFRSRHVGRLPSGVSSNLLYQSLVRDEMSTTPIHSCKNQPTSTSAAPSRHGFRNVKIVVPSLLFFFIIYTAQIGLIDSFAQRREVS